MEIPKNFKQFMLFIDAYALAGYIFLNDDSMTAEKFREYVKNDSPELYKLEHEFNKMKQEEADRLGL